MVPQGRLHHLSLHLRNHSAQPPATLQCCLLYPWETPLQSSMCVCIVVAEMQGQGDAPAASSNHTPPANPLEDRYRQGRLHHLALHLRKNDAQPPAISSAAC
jgi:hypothetical protein